MTNIIRQLCELACIASIVAGCYLAWTPLAYIVGGLVGLLWLAIDGDRNGATRR